MFASGKFIGSIQTRSTSSRRRTISWAIAASALATVILASAASATIEAIVTFDGDESWVSRTNSCPERNTNRSLPSTAFVEFETGPADPPAGNRQDPEPPAGLGSLQLAIGENGTSRIEMRQTRYNGQMLNELELLSYWTWADATNTDKNYQVYLTLDLDTDGDVTTVERTLVFGPWFQSNPSGTVDSTNPNRTQAPSKGIDWQFWDARNGEWYIETGVTTGPGSPANPIKLDQFSFFATARLAGGSLGSLSIKAGCDGDVAGPWQNFIGNADALNIKFASESDSTLHNFEDPATATPETTPSSSTQSPVSQGSPTSLGSSPTGGTGGPGDPTNIGGQTSNPPPPASSPAQSPTTGQSPTSGQSPTTSATATSTATSAPTATQTTTPGATGSASPTPGATQTASPSPSPSPSPTFPDSLSFDTDLSIRYRNSSFRGRASSPLGSCERDRAVVVRKVRPGRDRVVGRDRTDSTGGWRISQPNADGRFYAVARATQFTASDGTRIACLRARSRTISA